MRRHDIERIYNSHGITVAVAKAVVSAVLALSTMIVGPVFNATWSTAIRIGSIGIQLAASIWRAGPDGSERDENSTGSADSPDTEEMLI